jgi:heme/copper-type cytochrome/quinol oxidase subunit 2
MKKLLFTISLFFAFSDFLMAQCAMCKGAAETSMEAGQMQAAGINLGVLYVLVIVSIILGGFAYVVWKHRNADGDYQ